MAQIELYDAYATATENGHCKAVKTVENVHLAVDCQNLLPYIDVGDRVVITRLSAGQVKVVGADSNGGAYLSAWMNRDTLQLAAPETVKSIKLARSGCDISLNKGRVVLDAAGGVNYQIV